ncbi:MAG TPA: hypothetical protein VNK96_04500 [Fimbriimonadales bacterium]|nr:hypothetical protein [Fimbriimonadales bacterium]
MESPENSNVGTDTALREAKLPAWVVVGFVFVILSSPVWLPNLVAFGYDPFAGANPSQGPEWRKDLLGKRVNLPSKDVQGYKIPKDRNLFVFSMSCSP